MGKALVTLACLMVLTGFATGAQANLIVNGGFEGGNLGNSFVTLNANGDVGDTSISGWTVYGSVDWVSQYWQPSKGGQSLDLAGYFMHGMVVSDPFQTSAGTKYQVTFDMAGNPDSGSTKSLLAIYLNAADVEVYGGTKRFDFAQAGHTAGNMGWQDQVFDFVATGDTSRIAFMDVTNMTDLTQEDDHTQAWGAALDNVSVDVAPVPEPASVLLVGAGLAGFGVLRRRSRR